MNDYNFFVVTNLKNKYDSYLIQYQFLLKAVNLHLIIIIFVLSLRVWKNVGSLAG